VGSDGLSSALRPSTAKYSWSIPALWNNKSFDSWKYNAYSVC